MSETPLPLSSNLYSEDRPSLLRYQRGASMAFSAPLKEAAVECGTLRYSQLYWYFWHIVELNRGNCLQCHDHDCYNRFFLIYLKNAQLTQNDLYVLAYITVYFLDLLMSRARVTLAEAYYMVSLGHSAVMTTLLTGNYPSTLRNGLDEYQGYLLSVVYYLLPDFKYPLHSGQLGQNQSTS